MLIDSNLIARFINLIYERMINDIFIISTNKDKHIRRSTEIIAQTFEYT